MKDAVDCKSLEEVRANIDRIDRELVGLLAERGAYVIQAAGFKKTVNDVKAPQRVKQVISNAVGLAQDVGADPTVVERVYREMVAAFIEAELIEHAALNRG